MSAVFAPQRVGGNAVFADQTPSGTSTVSADLMAAYAVRELVGKSFNATYAVKAHVHADLAASFSVGALVHADFVGSYGIASPVVYVSAPSGNGYPSRSCRRLTRPPNMQGNN